MKTSILIGLACIMMAGAAPAFAAGMAADTMKPMKPDAMKPMTGATMGMMGSGEVMAFMPNGQMGKMTGDHMAMSSDMMKMAHPVKGCLLVMQGKDGKTYMIDAMSGAAMKECEKIAK